MPDIDFIRADIEHRRRQVQRLRSEIRELQHSGISSVSVEVLLDRMRNKIDELCAERDRLKKEQPGHNKNKVLGGRRW
jgi:phage shock protein A